jgi:hypothetical protein
MAESGYPIVSDELYGRPTGKLEFGLRAIYLGYSDPFIKKRVEINATTKYFTRHYGFSTFQESKNIPDPAFKPSERPPTQT